ncbi:MAG: fatty acyl-AMP ligase [Pyrinomonadaceae bacterium]
MTAYPYRLSESAFVPSELVELLRHRALKQADKTAYAMLTDGEEEEISLSYSELDQQARLIGAALQSMGAAGGCALLLYPQGLDFIAAFFGCLYAGVIAIPAFPPSPSRRDRMLPRLLSIAGDARPVVALTTTSILSSVEHVIAEHSEFQSMNWLATDTLGGELAESWQYPDINGETLAFLQYTSGSTSTPKGVMVSHGNLLYNERMIELALEHTEDSTTVVWLPLYHDLGLIGNVLQSLYVGSTCVLMSPVAFLQRPLRWLSAISRYKAHTSGGPNFAYDLCVRKITPEQRATLDLSNWRHAFSGAEPIRYETLERFAAAFESCGFRKEAFYPCYGLAESTLFVTGGLRDALPVVRPVQASALESHKVIPAIAGNHGENVRLAVGCGKTWLEEKVIIVNHESLTQCAPDEVGEIWIKGKNVAQGYWNRLEESEQTFRAHLADTGEGPFLRTGDLGFLHDGELFVTGRIKDLIIIDGSNHYPQDIELTVQQCHPAVRADCVAAFSIDVEGEERLVVVAEVDRHFKPGQAEMGQPVSDADSAMKMSVDAVIKAIRRAISQRHDIQVHALSLLKFGSIPKTSSGKIQRFSCRARFLANTFESVS